MRVANFAFGANDALREGWRGNQERPRDLLGFQAANFSQRQGDARVRRERRVAAGKNQSQPVVLQVVVKIRSGRRAVFQLFRHPRERRIEAGRAAQPIDGFEASRGNEPGTRILRNAFRGP